VHHKQTLHDDQTFPAIDYFERSALPFVVAINKFDGAPIYQDSDLREALSLRPQTPLIECDARDRRSAADALAAVVMHALRVAAG
jgi:signal recognition particle receptor subunit beta